MDRILRCVRLLAPEFDWVVSILHARDYLLPQTRVRVFLRGMRKAIINSVPACLPALGTRHIREALAKLPCTPRSALTPPQQNNLTDFESNVVKCVWMLGSCSWRMLWLSRLTGRRVLSTTLP